MKFKHYLLLNFKKRRQICTDIKEYCRNFKYIELPDTKHYLIFFSHRSVRIFFNFTISSLLSNKRKVFSSAKFFFLSNTINRIKNCKIARNNYFKNLILLSHHLKDPYLESSQKQSQ